MLHRQTRAEILEAESLTGLVHAEVWIDFRDALDDFATAMSYYLSKDKSRAEYKLRESEVHFKTTLQDAWLKAASIQIDSLEKLLSSWRVIGDTGYAYERLSSAIDFCAKSRSTFPTDVTKSSELAKMAAKTATEGLGRVHLSTSISVPYFFGVFSVVLLALLSVGTYVFFTLYRDMNSLIILAVGVLIAALAFALSRKR